MADERNEKLSGEGELRSPLLTKLDNFWYHYKWQFLAGLLALVVLVVGLVQCAGNGKGDDAYVMYAGGYTLSGRVRGDFEESLRGFTADRNGDGKVLVAVADYAIYTKAEINEKFENVSDRNYVMNVSENNRTVFDQQIMAGEASLCFLSPSLFEDLAGGTSGSLLRKLSDYATDLPDGAEVATFGEVAYGVRLSSLALYTYPGFSSLPADTIVCIRTETSMNSLFGGNEAKQMYEANLALFSRLMAAPVYAKK